MSVPNPPSYILKDKLGKGTNATVYKAFKKNNNSEIVAIKCIDKKFLNKAGHDNLISEISILKEVKHENIVQMLDFIWDSQYIYLILEYCAAGDLSGYLKKHGALSESLVQKFLRQLALGLQELYFRSILHMDLKPQNILLVNLNGKLRLKIADFGFAQSIEEESVQMRFLRGSLLYMAPEVYKDGLYSGKCDLWSVGVILYECLFGKAPFHSTTLEELRDKLLADWEIVIPQKTVQISDTCRGLLQSLLQRKIESRISYDEFLHHPYLDLEHAPCAKSKQRAELLLEKSKASEAAWNTRYQVGKNTRETRSTRLAKINELESIYQQRLDALTHLSAALQYETKESIRNQLKEKLSNEIDSAEVIKCQLDSLGSSRTLTELGTSNKNDEKKNSTTKEASDDNETTVSLMNSLNEKLDENTDFPELSMEAKNNFDIDKFLRRLRVFYEQIDRQQFKEALRTFTDCFQEGYTAIKNLPKSSRRDECLNELKYSMDIAEQVKQITEAQSTRVSINDLRNKNSNESNLNNDGMCLLS